MFKNLGLKVLAVDLDPQANLTTAFLDEERWEELHAWDAMSKHTIMGALQPLVERLGDVGDPYVERMDDNLWLLPGDLSLSTFEDRLAMAWAACLDDNKANAGDGFRVETAFYRVMVKAAAQHEADLVLVDVGPSLGALNRAALLASDYVVMPLGASLFSLQGLRNLGPALREWRDGWSERKKRKHAGDVSPLAPGTMKPAGYVVMQHVEKKSKRVKAYATWLERIPSLYRTFVLGEETTETPPTKLDPNRLGSIRHFRSLMPLAEDARKPVFALTPADGAIGSHGNAVRDCYDSFEKLALTLAAACQIDVPLASLTLPVPAQKPEVTLRKQIRARDGGHGTGLAFGNCCHQPRVTDRVSVQGAYVQVFQRLNARRFIRRRRKS